ncbi:cGMP-inhibited 3',5'-cyclic phosphodiesterase A-like protein [Lates japonicus]|uniref:cGMP-inhibited 3',5'-cyclic phosphodiesterase A-like protein n=1 Tax=Lates japonicus TaxID=270547 RepID=A0AAD3MPY1_LATJO|nr:cGMP-inhibited 3',5'-cyclic phosphodiesterase A-like protein [Lates japonicus]
MSAESDSTGAHSSTHEKSFSAPDRNGYVKTCVIPLCRDRDYESWVRLMFTKIWSSQRLRSAVCVGSLSVFLALLVKCADWKAEASGGSSSSSSADNRLLHSSSPLQFVTGCAAELLQTCWSVVSPLFTLVCAFFWVGVYLIRCGVLIQTVLSLLTVCHLGEAAAWSLLDGTDEQLFSFTTAAVVVLVCVATGALMVARLNQGISVIVFISIIRTISLFSLHKVRATWRPYVAYLVGVLGILLARYADKLLPNQGRHKEGCTPVTGAREEIPVFKRRRRSSSVIASDMAHSQSNSKSHRRTSLPCIQRDQLDGCQLLQAERLNPLGETRRASNHRHNPTQLELLDRHRPPVLTHSTHINTSGS